MDLQALSQQLMLSIEEQEAFRDFCAVRVQELDKKMKRQEQQLSQMITTHQLNRALDEGLQQAQAQYDWTPEDHKEGAAPVLVLLENKRKELNNLRQQLQEEAKMNPSYLILQKHQRIELLKAEQQWLEKEVLDRG